MSPFSLRNIAVPLPYGSRAPRAWCEAKNVDLALLDRTAGRSGSRVTWIEAN